MKTSTPTRTPSQLAICLGLSRYAMKATFRNKAGFFFSLVFPLIFVSVFGMLGNFRHTVKLGIAEGVDRNNPAIQAIQGQAVGSTAPLELVYGREADLEAQLSADKIAAVIAPGSTAPSGITLITSQGNPTSRAAAQTLIGGLVGEVNLRAAGVTNRAVPLDTREISGHTFRFIDFALPGQIGFSMLSLATFGMAYNLSTLRKTLVLKRMLATTARPITLVVAQCLSRSVQAVVQTAIIIAVGVFAFGFTLTHGWVTVVEMLVLAFLGIMAFLGFGILLSNVAADESTLPVVLNLFNLPQVLLAGVFFPIDGMPGWVQAIGNNLPLSYLNASLRAAATDGRGLAELWPYILGMFAWAMAAYVLAARSFKPE